MRAFQDAWNRFQSWLLQDAHKQRAQDIKQQVEKAFTEHPEQTGETYLQHLRFTAGMTCRLAFSSIVLLTHGLFPFLFTRTASNQIEKVYAIMKSRIPKNRLDEIDQNWTI